VNSKNKNLKFSEITHKTIENAYDAATLSAYNSHAYIYNIVQSKLKKLNQEDLLKLNALINDLFTPDFHDFKK
jgi:hypothetical protein